MLREPVASWSSTGALAGRRLRGQGKLTKSVAVVISPKPVRYMIRDPEPELVEAILPPI